MRKPGQWLLLACVAALAGCAAEDQGGTDAALLVPEKATTGLPQSLPVMRWDAREGSDAWTVAALGELRRSGVALVSSLPADINQYCPAYEGADPADRRAFWAGFVSALSKHESTYNPQAKGGGGRWLGLLQIAPATAKGYGCEGGLLNGADNVSCALKIMAKNVARDQAIADNGQSGWQGVARDWGPMRSRAKRADIAAWTSQQSYCQG